MPAQAPTVRSPRQFPGYLNRVLFHPERSSWRQTGARAGRQGNLGTMTYLESHEMDTNLMAEFPRQRPKKLLRQLDYEGSYEN